MKIGVHKLIEETRMSFEAENEAEQFQLAHIQQTLVREFTKIFTWRQEDGSHGITICVKSERE